MKIICPTCYKVYILQNRKIPEGEKVTTKCKKCGGKIVLEAKIEKTLPTTTKAGFPVSKDSKAEVKERVPIKKERFEPKKSSLLMMKLIGIGGIFGGVVLYLIRHSIPGGIEAAVVSAIICSMLGIVVFLAVMQMDKYFIEISDQGINVNNREDIIWKNIKEVKMENYNYHRIYNIGRSIEIYHFDKNGKKKFTSLPCNIKEDEKLYKIIKDHINSYPDTEMEIENGWRRDWSSPLPRLNLYVLPLTVGLVISVGLVIFIIFSSINLPPTVSNVNIPTNCQPTNQSVPESEAYEAILAGYNFYKKGYFNNAIVEYTKAVDIDPDNHVAYYNRGVAFLKTGEDNKALTDFKRSIELDPHHFESYQNLEWILAKKGELDTIIIYWNEFLELEPDHAQAYLCRGRAYYHQENWDAALKDAKKSCDLGNSEGCMRYKQLKEKNGGLTK